MGSLACCTCLVTMRTSTHVLGLLLAALTLSLSLATEQQPSSVKSRDGKAFSLFSIVQFPNQQCTGASSSTTYGTCYTSSECSAKGGSADGNCAAGFGVCCVIYTTTCGSAISGWTSRHSPGSPPQPPLGPAMTPWPWLGRQAWTLPPSVAQTLDITCTLSLGQPPRTPSP